MIGSSYPPHYPLLHQGMQPDNSQQNPSQFLLPANSFNGKLMRSYLPPISKFICVRYTGSPGHLPAGGQSMTPMPMDQNLFLRAPTGDERTPQSTSSFNDTDRYSDDDGNDDGQDETRMSHMCSLLLNLIYSATCNANNFYFK